MLFVLGIVLGFSLGYLLKINRKNTKPNQLKSDVNKTEFYLATETLFYLRQDLRHGLTAATAQKVVEIIKGIIPVDAVAITDLEQIIGFSGVGCKNHRLGRSIITNVTKEAIDTGQVKVINNGQFNCSVPNCSCPLKAAVIVPLYCGEKVVGTLKLYQVESFDINNWLVSLAKGLGKILSIQIELAENEHQKQLAAKAKLEALQAQIRPHFLFNVLNAIIHCSRENPEQARQLLVELAKFFRKTLKNNQDFISLSEEIEYIKTYLTLEKARFGERLSIKINVDPQITSTLVPVLSIQPLVENAIVHGISCSPHGGSLSIVCKPKNNKLYVLVWDNGKGIPKDQQDKILKPYYGTNNGLGLSNIAQRLVSIYGPEYRLKIRSHLNKGTTVLIKIPMGGTPDEGSMCEVS